MDAIICAAGFGSRLGMNLPKAMVLVNGKRIIDHQIDKLKAFETIHVVTGYRHDLLEDHLKKYPNIRIIRNGKPEAGLNHTMNIVASMFDQEAFITDGDIIFSEQVIPSEHSYIGVKDTISKAPICVRSDKNKKAIEFTNDITPDEWACAYQINPKNVQWNNEYAYESLASLLPMEQKRFDLFEIDSKDDLASVYKWLKSKEIKDFWNTRANNGKLLWRDLVDFNYNLVKPFVKSKTTILDLGCGDCSLVKMLAPQSKKIIAVDFIKHPDALPENVEYIQDDLLKYEPESSFDLILIFGVSNSFDSVDISKLYRKAKKALTKSGVLIVKHQCGLERDVTICKKIDGLKYHSVYRSIANETRILKEAGFKVNVVDPYPLSENLWPDTMFKAFICKS